MTKILLVDDDPIQLRLTSNVALKGGFDFVTAADGQTALNYLREDKTIGAVVLDLVMPELDGMAVLEQMKQEQIAVPVIVQTAHSSLETIVTAMRQGAADFFVKPVAPERLTISLRNALKMRELESVVRLEKHRKNGRIGFADIIGQSSEMKRVFELSRKAAKSDIPVLIEGESGAGKELIARAIQGASDRSGKPFVTLNCGAIPKDLVESTLFGHVKGAFTGATADHVGKFEEAHGGTLFLDEIGELPLDAQVKLLRAIQEGEIEPVGAAKPKKVNVRIISATNRRLLNLTKNGAFREDLFYRLNVFPIYLPPLRDRSADILPLANHFLTKLNAEAGKKVFAIDDGAAELLLEHPWPGNVRELENAIFRALILSDKASLCIADFPQISATRKSLSDLRDEWEASPVTTDVQHIDDADLAWQSGANATDQITQGADASENAFLDENGDVKSLASIEKALIETALDHHNWHMSNVARALGIGRSTLYRKLKEFGIDAKLDEKPSEVERDVA